MDNPPFPPEATAALANLNGGGGERHGPAPFQLSEWTLRETGHPEYWRVEATLSVRNGNDRAERSIWLMNNNNIPAHAQPDLLRRGATEAMRKELDERLNEVGIL